MSPSERPWWSSGTDSQTRVEPGPAAEERERREREKERREAAAANGAARGAEGRSDVGGDADHAHTHDHAPAGEVCSVCPICTALRLVGEVRPDLLVHLTEAARHMTLAAKAIIDAQASGFGRSGLEHIPLDDDPS